MTYQAMRGQVNHKQVAQTYISQVGSKQEAELNLSLIGSYPDIWAKFCLQYEQSCHLKIAHKNLLLSVHVTQASHE